MYKYNSKIPKWNTNFESESYEDPSTDISITQKANQGKRKSQALMYENWGKLKQPYTNRRSRTMNLNQTLTLALIESREGMKQWLMKKKRGVEGRTWTLWYCYGQKRFRTKNARFGALRTAAAKCYHVTGFSCFLFNLMHGIGMGGLRVINGLLGLSPLIIAIYFTLSCTIFSLRK